MRVQLISETTLKAYTLINDNVDAAFIGPTIQKAQDMGLQPLIGSNLLEKVCSLVESDKIGRRAHHAFADGPRRAVAGPADDATLQE